MLSVKTGELSVFILGIRLIGSIEWSVLRIVWWIISELLARVTWVALVQDLVVRQRREGSYSWNVHPLVVQIELSASDS